MTTPTGTIAMSDVNVELGLPSSTVITLNDTAVRNLAGIASGAISMNDLRGKSAGYKYIAYAFYGSYTGNPRIAMYPWSNATGFGVRFANQATIPSNLAHSIDTYGSSSGDMMYGGAASDEIQTFAWSSSGIGTRYALPSVSAVSAVMEARWSPNGQAIVGANYINSPYIIGYAYTQGTGFGTKYSDPGTLPSGSQYSVSWKDNSIVCVSGLTGASSLNVYDWSSGFGTRYANPSTAAASTYSMRFYTGNGMNVLVGSRTGTPYTQAYNFFGGFGSKYSNPATAPGGVANYCSFSEDGAYVAIAHDGFPYVTVYPWSSSGFGTKYTNPSTDIGGGGQSVGFQKGASVIGMTMDAGEFIAAYQWSSSGFGTRYAKYTTSPAYNQPNGEVRDMKFFGT